MANNDQGMDEVLSNGPSVNTTRGILYAAGIFVLGYVVYKAGYNAGLDVSNKVLRRHDKDVKKMEKEAKKREKQLLEELSPKKEKRKWWSK